MLADILTKAVTGPRLRQMIADLGLKEVHSLRESVGFYDSRTQMALTERILLSRSSLPRTPLCHIESLAPRIISRSSLLYLFDIYIISLLYISSGYYYLCLRKYINLEYYPGLLSLFCTPDHPNTNINVT